MPAPVELTRRRLLVCEGEDEKRFWESVLDARGHVDTQVIGGGGKSNLGHQLHAIVLARGFSDVERLVVAQDADDDFAAAFKRICAGLHQAKLGVPKEPWALVEGTPAVAAVVMPGLNQNGDLEALVLQAVSSVPSLACVEAFFSCLSERGVKLPRQLGKAKVHSYLASLDPPDRRLGEAAQSRLLPLESPVFDQLITLLTS